MSELEKQWNAAMEDCMRDLDSAPHQEDALVTALRTENARLREAAQAVVLAAWTDRWGRLHGHPTVVALERALSGDEPVEGV